MATSMIPIGHAKPYTYPLKKKSLIPILTTHYAYKIIPYPYLLTLK
jgi:hypothetical protein